MRGGRPSFFFVDDVVQTIWAPRSAASSKLSVGYVDTTIFPKDKFFRFDIHHFILYTI